jgi:hypothetical protein
VNEVFVVLNSPRYMPQSMNNPHDLEELKKLFPKAIFFFQSKEVPADIKRTYAPLPR